MCLQLANHPTPPGSSSEHSCEFGEWTVIEQAICTESGHSYSAVETEPTCTRQGYTTHTCGSCGNSYVDTYIDGTHDFKQSDTCEGCGQNIVDVAVEICDMSATEYDSVRGYVVPRTDVNYDAYIKGTGAMKDYPADNPYYIPFFDSGYTFVSAYIGDNVTSIGGLAIYGCSSLTSKAIPDDVISIDDFVFAGCKNLANVIFEDPH